jgi:alpha-tubulin suppressor-like RCC1 family protein
MESSARTACAAANRHPDNCEQLDYTPGQEGHPPEGDPMSRFALALRAGTAATVVIAMAAAASPAAAATGGVNYWGYLFGKAHLTPAVMSIPGTVTQVASSNTTLYALTSTCEVCAWGTGSHGQLGNGGTANSATPVLVDFPAGVVIASLPTDVMPNAGALAVDTDGNVWAWGEDVHGVDCMSATQFLTPVEVPLGNVTLITSASGHALYESGGTLYACGGNGLGELGDGSRAGHSGPIAVTGLAGQTIIGVYSSSQDEYALTASGALYAWGGNAEDELCNGSSVVDSDVPVQVPFTDSSPVTQVAAGGSLATNGSLLVGLADGTFWACGSDTFGQLGDGGSTNQALPIAVTPPAGVTYSEIAMSGATAYAVDSDGNVWSWGWDIEGQVGNGVKENAVLTPFEALVGQGVTQLSATAQDVVTFS